MTGLGIFFAAVLAFAYKKLKVEDDPLVDEAVHILPGTNCGGCGYLSCHDFAEHLASGEEEDPGKCRVMTEEHREQLFQLLGKEEPASYPVIPLVHCAALDENKKPQAEYKGLRTCRAANLDFGGGMECEYGCMGFGDCCWVCPFDALHMIDGLPKVDIEKCTGCGKCAEACPRGVITMQEKKKDKIFYVACSSHDAALRVRKICGVGCIACGICEKLSPKGFFKITDDLSRANFDNQKDPEEVKPIAKKCPTKVIKEI